MSADEVLDLRGIPCPQNTAKALLRLELLDGGERLKIWIDDGEPVDNFLQAMEIEEEYRILDKDRNAPSTWQILVEKKAEDEEE